VGSEFFYQSKEKVAISSFSAVFFVAFFMGYLDYSSLDAL